MNLEVGTISKIESREDYLHILEEHITKEFFEDNGDVFQAIATHYTKYNAVPERETLQRTFPNFQFYGGEEPLQYFIDKLKEQYKRKQFNTVLPKVAETMPVDINEAERMLQKLLSESRVYNKTGSSRLGSDDIATFISEYERREKMLGIDGYSTSWEYLDNLTCGYHGGELIIWMGRAKMGKTWLNTWQFHHIWQEHNVPTLFVTKEMGPIAIEHRFWAIDCRLPYDPLRKGLLIPSQKKALIERMTEVKERIREGELADFKIKGFELTDRGSGVSSLIPDIEQYLGNGGVLFVDGMYLIPDDRGESDWKGIINVAMDLKILAQKYNIPIIVTTQQSMEDKSDVPRLENAAYGRYIVQYADGIFAIGRSAIDRQSNRANIYALGQREGDIGHFTINMSFDPIDFTQAYDKVVIDEYNDEEAYYV